MKNKLIYLIALLIFAACSGNSLENQILLKITFDDSLNSKETEQLLNNKHLSLAKGAGINNSDAIMATYVGCDRGSERIVERIPLPESCLEATLNYAVMFSEDFNFVLSGKLHGLGPDNPITGGKEMKPAGWSTRVTFYKGGGIKTYIYHQNKPGKYGVSTIAEGFEFKGGQYHDVAIYTRVNNPAHLKNGLVELFVDGKLLVKEDSLQLRSEGGKNSEISKFLFSTFHGGHSPRYAPVDENGNYSEEYAWFDNFEIYKGKYIRAKECVK